MIDEGDSTTFSKDGPHEFLLLLPSRCKQAGLEEKFKHCIHKASCAQSFPFVCFLM